MKGILRLVITGFLCWPFVAGAQANCATQRYIDTVFHSVKIDTGIYFGTATPYGLLAQPQDLYLDFYQPAGDTALLRPLIIYQFGGGFVIGWREEPDIPQFCNYFAQLGYAVATIDYRIGLDPLDTNSTVRAYYRGVQDERAAIRYLCQHAQQYRIDTSRIILTGTSAGCFCAFGNTYTDDSDRPASTYGSTLEPTDMGCMDCSGNNDYGRRIPKIKAIVNMWGAIFDTSFIQLWKAVPTISFQGDQDVLVPYTYGYPFQLPVFPKVYGALPIHYRMDNVGILNELHPLVGYGHEPELLAPQLNDTIYNYSRKFLYPLIRPNTSAITGDTEVCLKSNAHYSVVNTPGSWYCWQLNGNGSIIQNTGNAITVTWNDTGTVSVSVTEQNNIDASGVTQSFQTRVIARPHASFGYNINQLEVATWNMSAEASSYDWSFGNGDTTSCVNPIENYPSGGTYTITLIAANGFCADTFANSVTIDSCPVAGITYTLNNRNAFFYGDTTNTLQYSWNFGDGDSISISTPNIFHQYAQSGTYTVVLTVKNQLGCVTSDTTQVTINTTGISNEPLTGFLVNCDLNGRCRIAANNNSTYLLQVMDLTGRVLYNTVTTGDFITESANLSAGVYLLRIYAGQTTLVRKFVKAD
ncbi:MAG TPA: PKD domain-containing protein [Chitinophagales bacterium]|nr:PKD domain-containing protein [Chitinophagales bacterium]